MPEYIEREAAMSVIDNMYPKPNLIIVREHLAKIPTADVAEVRHGKWKPLPFSVHYCSECHEIYRRKTYKRKRLSNYCPKCGAKMDGKGDK